MPRAGEIKRGAVIAHDGRVWIVREVSRSAPTARGSVTLFRFKLECVPGGERKELALKSDDVVGYADLARRKSTFSYREGDDWVFLDQEDYSPYALNDAAIGDAADYLTEGLEDIYVLVIGGHPVAIQLPSSVELEVTATTPVLKGATASRSSKPATLETGLEVTVPDYITPGERVRVNTGTGEFMGRVG